MTVIKHSNHILKKRLVYDLNRSSIKGKHKIIHSICLNMDSSASGFDLLLFEKFDHNKIFEKGKSNLGNRISLMCYHFAFPFTEMGIDLK